MEFSFSEDKPKVFPAWCSLDDFNAGMGCAVPRGALLVFPSPCRLLGAQGQLEGSLSLDQGWSLFYQGKVMDSQHNPQLVAGMGTAVRHPSHRIPGLVRLGMNSRLCLIPSPEH